jgi:glycosyltransferase involved in cell wall biosynthesis
MSSRKVELCLASPVLYPPRGGAETRFLSYLSGLEQRDVSVRLLSGTPKAKKITEQDKAQDWYQTPPGSILPTEPINGVPIHRVRLPDKSGWRRIAMFNRALLTYCCQTDYKPDVVQLIEPLSPLSSLWLPRLKALGVTRVFAYTLPYELPEPMFKKTLRLNGLRLLFKQLDCVVTGSETTRAHAAELGLRTRTEVIPNGVNLQRFQPVSGEGKKALKLSLGLGEMSRVMTTVGSIIPRKGIDLLLESWVALARRFPDLHFVLVGPRTDENDPKLKAFHDKIVDLVNASGAGNRVHFTGRVQNVESYLQASDLFVFASEREGMANVILEAMASGLPVVLTPHIGLPPDFGSPGHQYLLAERNPEAITAVVTELLDDDECCLKLARSGRSWVEERMGLDFVLDRYASLYHELAVS